MLDYLIIVGYIITVHRYLFIVIVMKTITTTHTAVLPEGNFTSKYCFMKQKYQI